MEREGTTKQFGLVPSEKIFGIGLGRTGTKSLSRALSWLGYKAGRHGLKRGHDLNIIRGYQFWIDIAPASRYRFLDHCFPEAKFILTVRKDIDDWIESCRQYELRKRGNKESYYKDGTIRINLEAAYNRFLLFGRVDFNERDFRMAYYTHFFGVMAHFEFREVKLLVMDICAGDSWEKLCPFLGCEIPDYPFPHKHRARSERRRYDTEDTG